MSGVWIGPNNANWAPDRRVSLPLAAVAALLALSGFVLLVWQPVPPRLHPDSVSILLHATAASEPMVRRHNPARAAASIHSASHRVKVQRPVGLPPQHVASMLDLSVPPTPSAAPLFLAPKPANTEQDLAGTLNAPRKQAPGMQDGDAYRNSTGETVIKAGGECGRMQSIQMSPSPTNKAAIGFLTHCPGDYQPTLGDQLLKWAETKQKPAPPR